MCDENSYRRLVARKCIVEAINCEPGFQSRQFHRKVADFTRSLTFKLFEVTVVSTITVDEHYKCVQFYIKYTMSVFGP